tara:strand:+ start:1021 stop:2340 length:1320 start_codon:yes stop_codon:yes gene_type:complete
MTKIAVFKDRLNSFKKKIYIPGDKSISIRWVLLSSIADGISKAENLLMSEDVLAAIDSIKKLGIKTKIKKKECIIFGKGLNGYKFKKNITINAKNSGTLGRLILGLLINSPNPIKLIGDKSLSKRDFKRVADPLSKFGAQFKLSKNKNLPLTILGSNKIKKIEYSEKKGSAQCKGSVMLGAIKARGTTTIKAKKSRNHTELMYKYLKLPISVKKEKENDIIKVSKAKFIKPLKYKIPSDISSSAFFIVLTALSKNSDLVIKNVNINPSRIGIVTILKKMGISIIFKNVRIYKREKIADIRIKSPKKIKSINCPSSLNSGAIDEFLLIFLVAAKANGISYFKNLEELNQKESPRLKWGEYILNQLGIKTVSTKGSLKIYGNPKLSINKKVVIKNFLKDHRVFMTSVVAALSFGGKWVIHDKDSIKTSFPNFLKIIEELKS